MKQLQATINLILIDRDKYDRDNVASIRQSIILLTRTNRL